MAADFNPPGATMAPPEASQAVPRSGAGPPAGRWRAQAVLRRSEGRSAAGLARSGGRGSVGLALLVLQQTSPRCFAAGRRKLAAARWPRYSAIATESAGDSSRRGSASDRQAVLRRSTAV